MYYSTKKPARAERIQFLERLKCAQRGRQDKSTKMLLSEGGNGSRFGYTEWRRGPSIAGGRHLNINSKESESVDGPDISASLSFY